MASLRGSLVDETFPFDGGRRATAYVPTGPADSFWYDELPLMISWAFDG